jgi:transposase
VETDATRMCALLVGLPDVNVLAVEDQPSQRLRVHAETTAVRVGCSACGSSARVKDRPVVALVDLPAFGRPAVLVWRKRRWCCPERDCDTGTWTEHAPAIAGRRSGMTDRAGRWVTVQVGREGRTVAEVARELGCDWHTVMDAVVAYGAPLIDDPGRIGTVTALGLDETLFARTGRWRTQAVVHLDRGREPARPAARHGRGPQRQGPLCVAEPPAQDLA